jgi:hypothetical protein
MRTRTIPASLLITALLSFTPALGGQSQTQGTEGETSLDEPRSPPDAEASPLGEVVFPHDEHSDEMDVECEECHHETNASPLAYPHPELFTDFWVDCQICHHEPGATDLEPQACSNCHHATTEDAADETLSAKVVIHELCWSCHEIGVGAEASDACEDCHTGL